MVYQHFLDAQLNEMMNYFNIFHRQQRIRHSATGAAVREETSYRRRQRADQSTSSLEKREGA